MLSEINLLVLLNNEDSINNVDIVFLNDIIKLFNVITEQHPLDRYPDYITKQNINSQDVDLEYSTIYITLLGNLSLVCFNCSNLQKRLLGLSIIKVY